MTQGATTRDQGPAAPVEEVDPQEILGILAKHSRQRGGLIAVLEDIQAKYGYLPQEALTMVGDETGRSLVDLYGIATFYGSFTLQPRGKHVVTACLGTACHVRGAPRIVKEFENQLGITAGETTPDKEFTLETVNCLGACALGPIVVADGRYFSNVRSLGVANIIEKARRGVDATRPEDDETIVFLQCGSEFSPTATGVNNESAVDGRFVQNVFRHASRRRLPAFRSTRNDRQSHR